MTQGLAELESLAREIEKLRDALSRIANGGNVVAIALGHSPAISREEMATIAYAALIDGAMAPSERRGHGELATKESP